MCFDRERHTGSKDPLKENIICLPLKEDIICLPLKEDIICLPLKENIIWQIVGRDLKLVSFLPTLQTRKTAIVVAALQMKGETGSMDVCPAWTTSTEVESSLDLNVLLSKMRNNLTFGMDTQITIERKEIVSFTHMSKTD